MEFSTFKNSSKLRHPSKHGKVDLLVRCGTRALQKEMAEAEASRKRRKRKGGMEIDRMNGRRADKRNKIAYMQYNTGLYITAM